MTNATHPFDALMDITARPQAVFVSGEGGYLWDDSGKRYLDFVQGWAVNCLGHSPKIIADALAAQATLLLTPSPAFYNAPSLKLAKALVAHSCFDQVFFANSGAEPKVPGFPKAQLNDLDSVKQLISGKTVAVMLEPIQGEAGVWPATDQFLQELR